MINKNRLTLGVNHVYVWPYLGLIKRSVKMKRVCMYRLMHAQELLYRGTSLIRKRPPP
jgi:hypothetical protein